MARLLVVGSRDISVVEVRVMMERSVAKVLDAATAGVLIVPPRRIVPTGKEKRKSPI